MTDFSEINGVDISDLGAIQLSRSVFAQVDYNMYTPFRAHFLIYAVQNQLRLPSEASMMRCERRNQRKCVKGIDSTIVPDRSGRGMGRARKQRCIVNQRRRAGFTVPLKYGRQPVKRITRKREDRQIRRPRAQQFLSSLLVPPIPLNLPTIPNMIQVQNGIHMPQMPNLPSIVPPHLNVMEQIPQIPQSNVITPLTTIKQFVHKNLIKMQHKQQNASFKIKSPENILLKCARTKCRQSFEIWRKQKQLVKAQNIVLQLDQRPIYFQKKKANQKRRRLEKHQLIKKNRKALLKIFGDAIFRRGWPISRKQIKQALGIIEVDVTNSSLCFQGLADLVQSEEIKEKAQTIEKDSLIILQSPQKKRSDKIQNIKLPEEQAIEVEKVDVISTSI